MDKDKVGRYLLGNLSPKEKKSFEQELESNFDLQEEIYSSRIIFYLDDRLPNQEKEKFEQDLTIDVNLREDLRLQKLANTVIENYFSEKNELAQWESYKELVKDIPALSENNNDTPIVQLEPQKEEAISIGFWKVLGVAAACLIVVSLFSFGFLFSESSRKIAQSGMENFQLYEAERNGETSSNEENKNFEKLSEKLKLAQQQLEESNFIEAVKILELAQNQAKEEGNPEIYKVKYALATAYIGAKNYEKAITTYEKLLKEDDLDKKLDAELIEKAHYNHRILKIKKALGLKN